MAFLEEFQNSEQRRKHWFTWAVPLNLAEWHKFEIDLQIISVVWPNSISSFSIYDIEILFLACVIGSLLLFSEGND